MSDPKNPGSNLPGAEPDTTMIRPAADVVAGQTSGTDTSGVDKGARADRVRKWTRRNNKGSAAGSATPAPPASPAAGQQTFNQPDVTTHRADLTAKRPDMAGPDADLTTHRSELTVPVGVNRDETRVRPEELAEPTVKVSAEERKSAAFMAKVKERARTVSTGVVGAATGAMGAETAVDGVPAPGTDGDAGIHRPGVARRTRKARLRLAQIDPWSVMKTAFLFSVAAGIVLWVATGTIWAVISASGMFQEINKIVGDIIQTPGDDTPFRIQDYINTSKVMGTAALIAVIDVVIFTALATLGAFLYNLASAMIGGLELTLAED
ncbi:MAG: DUF3566 domain-containing protein [Propionibacteriaceae bacterium]|nr:DUF3566 domain-containing protein [Propionibacteriaceae bacterium]